MHAVRGMNLENLNERIQTQKATYYLHPFMWNIRNRQICEERIYIGGYQGLGRGESGETVFNGHKFYCGIIEIFWNKIELLVAQLCECGDTELFTLKCLILCHMHFTSTKIFKSQWWTLSSIRWVTMVPAKPSGFFQRPCHWPALLTRPGWNLGPTRRGSLVGSGIQSFPYY